MLNTNNNLSFGLNQSRFRNNNITISVTDSNLTKSSLPTFNNLNTLKSLDGLYIAAQEHERQHPSGRVLTSYVNRSISSPVTLPPEITPSTAKERKSRKRKTSPIDTTDEDIVTEKPASKKERKRKGVTRRSNSSVDTLPPENEQLSPPSLPTLTKREKSSRKSEKDSSPNNDVDIEEENTKGGRLTKGLRHFSILVCKKLSIVKETSYNAIADELIKELATDLGSDVIVTPGEEKNVRRRVYDALNVLMAVGIIVKDKKHIRWLGFESVANGAISIPTPPMVQPRPNSTTSRNAKITEECRRLKWQLEERKKRLLEKQQSLKEIVYEYHGKSALIERNITKPYSGQRIPFPFVMVSTDSQTDIECNLDPPQENCDMQFSSTFAMYDDHAVCSIYGRQNLDISKLVNPDLLNQLAIAPRSSSKLPIPIEESSASNNMTDKTIQNITATKSEKRAQSEDVQNLHAPDAKLYANHFQATAASQLSIPPASNSDASAFSNHFRTPYTSTAPLAPHNDFSKVKSVQSNHFASSSLSTSSHSHSSTTSKSTYPYMSPSASPPLHPTLPALSLPSPGMPIVTPSPNIDRVRNISTSGTPARSPFSPHVRFNNFVLSPGIGMYTRSPGGSPHWPQLTRSHSSSLIDTPTSSARLFKPFQSNAITPSSRSSSNPLLLRTTLT